LKFIKINDISLKIKDIYNKNQNDEKYLNQIIELYQIIVNLINNKYEIEYINDFDTLYKLGDNNNYLLNVLDIMDSFYAFIQSIDTGHNYDKLRKKK
jgi:nuclear transport factor 2 (NTF2) superfamily protein